MIDSIVDADAVVMMIADQNDREDPWEGPVPNHVLRFKRYRCALLPVADIELDGHGHDPDLAAAYSRTASCEFPPVVHDPVDRELIDGYHRVHACLLRGERTVLALIGIEEDADPPWVRE